MLSKIDTIADGTTFDDRLLHDSRGSAGARRVPYRAIGAASLGIAGLAVRSSDQALATAGALDVATARLDRSAGTLSSAVARLQDELRALTSPATSVDGQEAPGSTVVAFSSAILLRTQLERDPFQAVQAQADLDVSRVRWLLDAPPG
jgi:hypothetical protein